MKEGKFWLVADYIACYVRELTRQKEEAFLAITEIDAEALPGDNIPPVEGCTLVRVSPNDYSDAVRYRNDGRIKKLVLLCMDSVRRIDSLKDFVECPALPEDKALLWKILREIFNITSRDAQLEDYVYTLLQNVPVEIGDLLEYLEDCISETKGVRSFSKKKINDGLNKFGIWRTKNVDLNRGTLKRWIRYSNPDVVRSRLEKALEDGKLEGQLRSKVVTALGKDDLEKLFNTVEFKEVEDFFRYKRPVKAKRKEPEQEERAYGYSYDKFLKEDYQDIESVEEDIRADIKTETEGEGEVKGQEGQEDTGPFREVRRMFAVKDGELERHREEIVRLQDILEDYAISDEKKKKWRGYLGVLLAEYDRALREGDFVQITPILLSTYCERQEKFISVYFELLGWLLTDKAMNHLCDNTELVDELQMLFCEPEKGKVEMSFYHPVAGLYFLRLKKLYEIACLEAESMGLAADIPIYMTDQEKLWFPIRFLQEGNKLYQLDYTSLREPGRIIFYERESRVANSAVNFRLLNSVIEEYILQNPYLGMLSVGIVDLDDFQGLPFLLRRLQRLVKREECLLSRITIQVVSLKERELRRELSRLYEMGMEDPDIYFRFTGGRYMKDSHELELDRLMEECDLLLFADTDVIYNAGRLIQYTEKPNEVKKRLGAFDLREQLDFFIDGENYIDLLWDTLQRIRNGGEVILSRWSNQELNLRKLREISGKVKTDSHFEAAVISTNDHLLRYIYREPHYCIRKSRVSGNTSLILTLSQQNRIQELSEKGSGDVEISLSRFLDELSGDEDFCGHLLETEGQQEVVLRVSYSEGHFRLYFAAETKEADIDLAEEDRKKLEQFAKELTEYLFQGKSYLAERFREMVLNELYGRAENYTMVMALYQLERYEMDSPEIHVESREPQKAVCPLYGSTDVLELLELLDFFREFVEIDESAVTRFQEYYKKEMLFGALCVAEKEKFLDERMRRNMRILYEGIRE